LTNLRDCVNRLTALNIMYNGYLTTRQQIYCCRVCNIKMRRSTKPAQAKRKKLIVKGKKDPRKKKEKHDEEEEEDE
jgi:hypothetical protein